MTNLLELQNLKKYFATQKAVDDMSFSIQKGSIFGLLGPNGAGKTTLLRMITGIFYPDSGQILFDGKKFDPLNDAQNIGYMPEERGLYKKMKIGEQAVYLAQLKGLKATEATQKAKDWFTKFEMQSWWNKKVEDLSKGMSQKLQFVTTVMHNPSLIILDEPFSGLDPVNANLIKEEIFKLAENGCTIIFSTHRMEQVEEICRHIVLMNKGKKILDGTVQNVKNEFKDNIYELKGNILPEHTMTGIFEVVNLSNGRLRIKLSQGTRPNDVLQYFINQTVAINSFNEVLPTLNDIFIKLVEGTATARQFQNIS
ncbi:MAG: ATP-binding cassette domain-containing protein [Chitinophagaceae bacterium]|jgi:ABC-2 type transport system ATP-binding protein|nr:ATP-binding cassette domain-containing protein [Chitinophagaceae bacterium]MBP6046156.1 ATP-binding cassette domain-containing protein [Ferruginibacter sp.]MBK7090058.1 ATP-binding cassette domain-containing protein [Chitinophagaceae bacterium]MBK8774553.1 ATP-binding cassette domain-containing protein [Chitinophagaceae bacterium]MBL0255432.1 ATP-binding cassette domain-containing protein [Chitinophagaceae bacterium]